MKIKATKVILRHFKKRFSKFTAVFCGNENLCLNRDQKVTI
jgi:site-specific DNA-adenine methylase